LKVLKIHLNNHVNIPKFTRKRQQASDEILYMLGDTKTSFQDALKSIEQLPMP